MQIYVEDKEADAIPGITDSGYHTLDRAYELPQRYVRERLPKMSKIFRIIYFFITKTLF